MNRLRHTYIYTLLFTLGTLLTCTSCVRDYNSLGEEDDGNKYLSLTFSLAPSGDEGLRVQGDDYSINSDKTNREDYVNDLRIFLIQDGVIKKNVFFTNLAPRPAYDYSTGSEDDGISYKYQSGKAQITFRLAESELGYYDLVVVANEGAYTNRASLDPGPDYHEKYDNEIGREIAAEKALKKALSEAKTLDDLKNIRIPVTRRFSDTHQGRRYNQSNPYIDVISPMTAEYEHVDFTEGGTKDHPRQIQLSNPHGLTTGVELLRTFAKVELIYKKCIWLSWDENGKEELKWIGPWRFQHPYGPHIYQMPKDVSLFPIQKYSSAQDTVSSFLGRESDQYMARTGPQKRFIIGYDKIAEKVRTEGVPMGGGYLLDYRMYFYIPEKLVPEGPDETVKPLYLWFIWYYYSGFRPWLDIASNNHQLRAETRCYFDVLNDNDKAEDYVERTGSFNPSSKSVYRNRLYKITLTPTDVQPPAGNGEAFDE